MLFDSAAKIDNAVSAFKNLLNSTGWQLFVAIVNENIEVVKDQIIKNPEGLSESDMNRLRDKLAVMEEMRDTPQNNIKNLTSEETEEPDLDPFDTVDTLPERNPEKQS